MLLVYPIKIKYKDGIIVGLISPHLRMDFIIKYKELSSTDSTLSTEYLVVRDLERAIEDYVGWIQDSNYVLRPPNHSQILASQQDEQWINVNVNILIKTGPFEFLGKIVGIFLFLGTSALDEFFFILGARLNKIPYTTLILPILADFMIAGIIYAYSGAASNIMAKGKELDDWWSHKKFSPTETEIEKDYPLCSSWYLSKLLLCILPIAHTIFQSFGYWQNIMSMRYKFEESNLDDPIITPKFIYSLALVGTSIGAICNAVQYTSFALKGTGALKTILDSCYNACKKKYNFIKRNNYFEVLVNNEQTESEIKIDNIDTSTMKLIYPIKIKYKDGVISDLFSPHLKINFISQYLDLAIKSVNEENSLNSHLKVELLHDIVASYVSLVQSKNYKLRHPDSTQVDFINENDQWVNVQINIQLKNSPFEKTTQIVSISIFLVSFTLDECFFILAARMNKISYITIVIPVMADFLTSGIIYYYSGAISNMAIQGKKLDDWFYNRCISPFEESERDTTHPLLSTWNLSRTLLCTLVLSNTIFGGYSVWQGLMAMKKQFEESNINDPIITPAFIYDLAIITVIVNAFYQTAKHSSFALKATNTLKILLDSCHAICKKKLISIRGNNYFELSINDEQTESETTHEGTNTDTAVVFSPSGIIRHTKGNGKEDIELSVFFITDVVYNNLLIKQDLLYEAKKIGGIKAVQNIINLGENTEVSTLIIEYIEKYGVKHVVNILFGCATKNYKVETDLSNNQITAITTDTQQNSKIFTLSEIKKIVDQMIEQNFFLNTEKGKEFVQAVANHFDTETLLNILELGRDQEIAEQILIEAETQGVNMVISTLLGKEPPVTRATDNLENILGQQELNQLRMTPNGIFNAWSNKSYLKVVEYINNLAKNLDDLLNTGKSGSQVAVTLALLEEWLGFAASGQRFIGGRPPYYNPDDNDDWSCGGGGSSDGNNNSLTGNFDNQHGFVGLILPSYNSTDYNDTAHQM